MRKYFIIFDNFYYCLFSIIFMTFFIEAIIKYEKILFFKGKQAGATRKILKEVGELP